MRHRLLVLATVACLLPLGAAPALSVGHEPVVVIAVVDSGINPYHAAYRDDSPLGQVYPGDYLPDFPPDVQALHLTLNAGSVAEALAADCEDAWATVEPGRLYWIPGTRIVGAIFWPHSTDVRPGAVIDLTEDRSWNVDCTRTPPRIPPIVTTGGHGNMVSSKIVGRDIGHCEDIHCRLVVVNAVNQEGLDFVASNTDWIDLQTNQWFSVVTSATPLTPTLMEIHGTEALALTPGIVRAIEQTAQRHLSVWATGNVLPVSTLNDGRLTPSVVMVGGHDNGYPLPPHFASTPAHVVGDVCANWAATPHSMDGYSKSGSGTSSAAPHVAGGAAAILLEARRILGHQGSGIHGGVAASGDPVAGGPLADGVFTLDEWKSLLLRTATERPVYQDSDGDRCEEPFAIAYDAVNGPAWSEIPPEHPSYSEIGYGGVDDGSIALAVEVLRGTATVPDRSEVDAYFELDRAHRGVQYVTNSAG